MYSRNHGNDKSAMTSYFTGIAAETFIWIGLHKDSDDKWVWSSSGKEATDIHLGLGQPTDIFNERYGCYGVKQQKVHDYGWDGNLPFICEI